MNEASLKLRIVELLSGDFILKPEVSGLNIVDGSPVRADFLAYPDASLVDRGFKAEWIGIEVKELQFAKHPSKKLYGTFWQAVTYSQSRFIVDDVSVRPSFCVVYIGPSQKKTDDPSEAAQRRRWQILLELGVYSNTGILRESHREKWEIFFGQGSYFKGSSGQSKVPRGLRRYTGNTSKRITK